MATTQSFNNMLKKYMPYNLLMEELIKRDYFLMKVKKDQKWAGGEMQIPFLGGKASSIAVGQLTDEADITERRHALGTLSDYKEIWGSLVFNQSDLDRHDSLEKSFISILPEQIETFISDMKEAVSIMLLNGTHVVKLDTAAAASDLANGIVVVDRPIRLEIGQYLELGPAGGPAVYSGYVKQIDMENYAVEFSDNKDLSGAAPDLAAAGVVAGHRGYLRGAIAGTSTFTSLPDQLLSAANGGSAALFGVTKLAYPHLQAQNFPGSTITSDDLLLEKIFDFYNDTRQLGKGNPTDAVMSYKRLAAAMKAIENGNQGAQYMATDTKANKYGWTEITVVGVKGQLKLVGVPEMDDDKIFLIDWDSMQLHSNGFFERRTAPDGKQFYEVRSTTGYKYIVDTRFYGELVVNKPSHNGVIVGVPNY